MSAPLLAAVCSVILAGPTAGETHCEPPIAFDRAARMVEARLEFYDPQLDKAYPYLLPSSRVDVTRPVRPEPPRQVAPREPNHEPHGRYERPYSQSQLRSKTPPKLLGTMRPVP